MAGDAALELGDIQGIVLNGWVRLKFCRCLFLGVHNAGAVKRWLGTAVREVATARRRPKGAEMPGTHVQIGFTAAGLAALGLPSDAMQTFPRDFRVGMAHPDRSAVLGDRGDSAPERWQVGGPNTPPVHILLMLYALTRAALDEVTATLCPAEGLEEVFRQDSVRHDSTEPFGFRDGISQPAIEGAPQPVLPGQDVVKPGEFILGYVNAYGEQPPMPTVSAALDPANLLTPHAGDPARRALGRNGTFLVLRKLAQDVDGFWRFLDAQTRRPDGSSDPERRTWLAAKLVGRWPSGAPLVLAPDRDDPALGSDGRRNNDFRFASSDPYGEVCPLGSHVRRCNPRDSLVGSPARSLRISNRHRIVRRGRPYQEASERGLLFVALNADLERQFEFIQQAWVNDPAFNGLHDNKDPLAADNDGGGVMMIPGRPVRQRIHGLPRFVTVRGGGYFFVPGIRALRFLATCPLPPEPAGSADA